MTLVSRLSDIVGRVRDEFNAVRSEVAALPKPGSITFDAPGTYFDNGFTSGVGTVAGVANRCDICPMVLNRTTVVDQVGVAVSTAVASAQGKIVVYASSSATGLPTTLLFESSALDFSATGFKTATFNYTFEAGRVYWVGIRHSSTATIRTIAVQASLPIGADAGNYSVMGTILRRTISFATAAPNPWGFNASEITGNVTPPSIRFRVA